MSKEIIDLHDIIMTPKGEMEVQSIMYDPKTKKYSYSVLGPKGKYWSEDEVKLVKKGEPGGKRNELE